MNGAKREHGSGFVIAENDAGGGASFTAERYVRSRVLDALPSKSQAVTISGLASRSMVALHKVHEIVALLITQGDAATTVRHGITRYYRTNGEGKLKAVTKKPKDDRTMGQRVMAALPRTRDEARTVAELAETMGLTNTQVQSAMARRRDCGEVVRLGVGGPEDPYRYYAGDDSTETRTDSEVAGPARVVGDDGEIMGPSRRPMAPAELVNTPRSKPEVPMPTAAMGVVISILRARATEATHDAELLKAAATLCERLLAEELEP